jgi:CheY-like chemotaxis protein
LRFFVIAKETAVNRYEIFLLVETRSGQMGERVTARCRRRRAIAEICNRPEVPLPITFNLLASYGYKAETFTSAELFLASDGPSRSNCIIADIQMRERQMTGLELLERVRAASPSSR